MKRLLNTLYVTKENAWVHKDGNNAVVAVDNIEQLRVPVHLLAAIVCIGRVSVSPPLMGFCAQNGICISFLSEYGRFHARVEGAQSGNILLRRAQHKATLDPVQTAQAGRHIVQAKVANTRVLVRRVLRDYGADQAIEDTERRLGATGRQLAKATDIDSIRGLEGDAANAYFGIFDKLIRRDEAKMRFNGRSRRPPLDAPNAVLSFLYVLLTSDCRGVLETVGLDPQMGFLHRDRPGRASLALDLVEEFRAPIADRVMLSLFNRRQLNPEDFIFQDGGSVLLTDDARKIVMTAYQERKRVEIMHPFLKEKMPLGLVPYVQAQLMARWLRGDMDGYPPYLWS
jgi:CRISP-associated protein Cas1